ncbi:hypothetical protein [Nonomuraea candida]|uniref:hypothetical protein n=1 Tax=Nonomuraea candida TaxID=359159 RepID=UPI0014703090|nr:hypothetical protein [Nonomuraea candida]
MRILAGLALASSAALVAAAPAQAAPVDPAKALKKQYAAGHGVRVSETSRMVTDGTTTLVTTTTGEFGFGDGGVVAADLRTRTKGAAVPSAPNRAITVGGHVYAQGELFGAELPEGKKWVRYPSESGARTGDQPFDVFRPEVLKTLVAKAGSFRGGTYRGSLTFKELGRIYGEKIDPRLGSVRIGYALGVNSKGLVTGIRSEYLMDFGVLGKTTSTVETRFSGWGAKIKVVAPPADEVVDYDELGPDTSVPQEIPNNSLNSLGRLQ